MITTEINCYTCLQQIIVRVITLKNSANKIIAHVAATDVCSKHQYWVLKNRYLLLIFEKCINLCEATDYALCIVSPVPRD
jgi:hypothetical protein